ncbi:MAG TPA: hypothetical protein VMZ71_05220 [Gemmataceae bacterium]|nr:hypothetical protein [Gemmataceae bacterium]
MATEKWSAMTSRANLLTTELNALAENAYSAGGTVLDNGTNLDRFMIAELTVDFVAATDDRAAIDLYMIPAPDGTNYADATEPSAYHFCGSFMVDNTAAAQRLVTAPFQLPPCKVKFVIHNRSGEAFPATGSVMNGYTFNRTIN